MVKTSVETFSITKEVETMYCLINVKNNEFENRYIVTVALLPAEYINAQISIIEVSKYRM